MDGPPSSDELPLVPAAPGASPASDIDAEEEHMRFGHEADQHDRVVVEAEGPVDMLKAQALL
eukprot:5579407-Pyramimonas_sp.AAC.1